MADSSFDIVSKYDKQEVANAVNTAAKEIANRYDFKNVGARVELAGEVIKLEANSEDRCKAVLDVVQTWLVKRGAANARQFTLRELRLARYRMLQVRERLVSSSSDDSIVASELLRIIARPPARPARK